MNNKSIKTGLKFDSSFFNELKGLYVKTYGEKATSPKTIKLNQLLAKELGINLDILTDDLLALLFSGSEAASGSEPIAQAYSGHQFGGFSPMLGDGRAILLGEVVDIKGNRRDIHLKGSGQTPFSRGGDGKAALGPVLREYILGEAMHALNIPATRGLAVTITGEMVVRQQMQTGAVLARVASSHLRVGSFQYLAARNEKDKVKLLADYTINRHFPELKELENPYIGLISEVRDRQASLIAQWVLVGFVHGVMNTDNMALSGETIDFGPCAFIDNYDPNAVYSSIDRQGRYSLSNQPYIGQWNLARFAETLLPLLDDDSDTAIQIATELVKDFEGVYQAYWLQGVCKKIGLSSVEQDDLELANNLFKILERQDVDYTNFFRSLSLAAVGDIETVRTQFKNPEKYDGWHSKWVQRLSTDNQSAQQRVDSMNLLNPLYIPRNHLVEEALAAAEDNNFQVFDKLLEVLANPYEEKLGFEKYAKPAPESFGPYKTFCGT